MPAGKAHENTVLTPSFITNHLIIHSQPLFHHRRWHYNTPSPPPPPPTTTRRQWWWWREVVEDEDEDEDKVEIDKTRFGLEFLGDFIGNLQRDLCVVWLGFLLVFLGFLLGFLGDFIWNFQRDLCVLLGLDFC